MALRRAAGWLRGSPCISTPERDIAVDDELISTPSERCIALMEDIDTAFYYGLSRESPNVPSTQMTNYLSNTRHTIHRCPTPTGNRVPLTDPLNALDGIGAQEGRVLFATTNKYMPLKPALC